MFLLNVPENLTVKRTRCAVLPKARKVAALYGSCSVPIALFGAGFYGAHPMAETIFGKIIAGQIPCHKVYEDEHVLAFLDIGPLTRGHTLVVPKEPAETLDQLSEGSAAALGRVLPRLCRAVIAATGVREYNVLQNNGASAHQAVFHVHFHIIPKPNPAEGLGMSWPARSLDPREAQQLIETMGRALARDA